MLNTSASFHQQNEISDQHFDRGRHKQHEHAFEDGQIVRTVTPNYPEQTDLLNNWLEAEDLPGESFAAAAGVLKRLLLWQIQADTARPRILSSIARRTIALAFAICPDQIPWQSLQQCADEFGATKQSFGKYSKEILELAHGNFQRSEMFRGAEHRKRRAETSRRQWDKRGRLASAEKRRVRAAWVKENPQLHEAELEKRRAVYAARQAKLSRKKGLETQNTPT